MILAQVCEREESRWRGWGRDLPDIDTMSGRSRISRPRIFGTRFRLLASDLSILKWNLLERKRDLRRRLRRRRCRRRRQRRYRRRLEVMLVHIKGESKSLEPLSCIFGLKREKVERVLIKSFQAFFFLCIEMKRAQARARMFAVHSWNFQGLNFVTVRELLQA